MVRVIQGYYGVGDTRLLWFRLYKVSMVWMIQGYYGVGDTRLLWCG